MPAMAFEGRFGQVVIQKRVVFEFGEFEFGGMEVERSLENAEGFLLVEQADRKEVADLEDEAASFLKEQSLGISNVLSKADNLLLGREMCAQISDGFCRILRELRKRTSKLMGSLKTLV